MKRHFSGAMLIAIGIVLGCALGSYQGTQAAAPGSRETEEQTVALVNQLKEIKTQVKDINSLLHNGSVKVVVLINPNANRP